MEKNQINFATARALGDHCLNEATSKGFGVSVVILDQFGTVTYYVRGDGQRQDQHRIRSVEGAGPC